MSFSKTLAERFGRVLDQTPYAVQDPLVKVQYVGRGNNVIFGRSIVGERYENLIYFGKILEASGGRSYLGADAWLDITFPHVIYITGTRGSGKSFDLGVIVEGLSRLKRSSPIQNDVTPPTSIVVDTQSQFWTLGYEPRASIPANKEQLAELSRWNIEPNAVREPRMYVPPGCQKFLGNEKEVRIRPKDISHAEWCGLVSQDVYGPQGHILAATIEALADREFELNDMLRHIADEQNWPEVAESSRNALLYRLEDYQRTLLFSADGLDVVDLLVPGQTTVFMLRDLRNVDKAVITSLLARQLFTHMGRFHNKQKVAQFFERPGPKENYPQNVWLVIDEAHVVAPKDEMSAAREALIEYVKRGRDAGLSLVLATQQPSAVDDRILSQVNISINHRLTFESDIRAAVNRVPTKQIDCLKMSGTTITDFGGMVRLVDSGQCFIGDHNTSRAVMVQVRPRVTAHGGYSPI